MVVRGVVEEELGAVLVVSAALAATMDVRRVRGLPRGWRCWCSVVAYFPW
jgi:hypothetical protein